MVLVGEIVHKIDSGKLFSVLYGETEVSALDKKEVEILWGTDDIDVLGGVYVLLTEEKFFSKLKDEYFFDEVFNFSNRYYKVCLIEDPDSDWSDSRFTVCHEILRCCESWQSDPNIENKYLTMMLEWLKELADEESDTTKYLYTYVIPQLMELIDSK